MTFNPLNLFPYLGVRAKTPPEQIVQTRAPAASDYQYRIGTLWVNTTTGASYQLTALSGQTATWAVLGGGSSDVNTINGLSPTAGNITIAGTANQISVGNAGSTVTLSLPAAITTPGSLTTTTSLTATTTVTAGTGITSTTGNIVATAGAVNAGTTMTAGTGITATTGNIVATAGAVNAGTTMTAGTGITATTGNIVATAGAVNAGTTMTAGTGITSTTGNIVATAGNVFANEGNFTGINVTLTSSPVLQTAATTGDVPTGATGDVNIMALENGVIMEQFILGAGQTIIAPRMSSTGLLTSLDLTNAEGAEYNFGAALSNSRFAFTIGTSAAFRIRLNVNAADIGGLDPFVVGFRKVQANDATFTNYTDFACIGARATTAADVCVIQTNLNSGGAIITNTTDAWTDGTSKSFAVNVSATGVVTFLINGVAPTVTQAFTFDNGDVVVPFIRHTFGAATPAAINWQVLQVGFQ